MDNFESIINSSNSVLILLPVKPYFDQVAAGLALYLSLREKKEATIACPSPMVVEFNRLVGVNKITQEMGNKNLVLKLVGYPAENIERVSYDIENSEFRLSVIPKPGFPSPKKEQVNLSYSGVAADTILLVGGANKSHFPSLDSKEIAGAKIIHIGTRALSVSPESNIMSFAKPASSCSEIVADLIKKNGFNLDVDTSTNLLAGIEEGSDKFTGSEVTAETFQIVADLMKAGGRRQPGSDYHKEQKSKLPPGSVPGEKLVEKKKDAPKDWLEPKIYKGTSIS